jgi:hypothetical protein
METRLLRINSRFKQPTETNTDFSFIYDGVNISSIQLLKFSCMRLFPNIYSPYDTLIINGALITIPTGQYTAAELAAYITSSGQLCNVNQHNKFEFPLFGHEITPTKLSTMVIGLPDIPVITPTVALNTPNLQGPDPIYIESGDVALSNCLDSEDSNGGNIPLVWSIASQPPYGFQISYEASDPTISQIDVKNGTLSNRRLGIRLTDAYGHTLVLPSNQHVDLIFKIFYMPNS